MLFASGEFLDSRDMVQVKYEMLRRVHEDGPPITTPRLLTLLVQAPVLLPAKDPRKRADYLIRTHGKMNSSEETPLVSIERTKQKNLRAIRLGRKGGQRRVSKGFSLLSKAERVSNAKKASTARWSVDLRRSSHADDIGDGNSVIDAVRLR